MPTTTDHRPAQDVTVGEPERAPRRSKWSAISIVAASVATLVIVFVMLGSSDDQSVQVQSIPAQPNTVSQWVAVPPRRPSVAPTPARPAEPAIDAFGFVDSPARCPADQQAVAIARTERSAMVVCETTDGDFVYRGVRLRDAAALQLDDVRPMPTGFEARNDRTTYRLSRTELVVIDGETLQSRDPVLEFRAS